MINLEKVRIAMGMTRRELAIRANVDKRILLAWEKGQRCKPILNMIKIAASLLTTVAAMYPERGESKLAERMRHCSYTADRLARETQIPKSTIEWYMKRRGEKMIRSAVKASARLGMDPALAFRQFGK